jgi:DNA polymerase elongation subunit (family B)
MRGAKERDLRDVYRMRQSALKWILVTCFGYLGYRNARFGRIEAHESVTAFARENLLRAVEIAEKNGFEVIHGIVDSLWLKRGNASESDFTSLCEEIKSRIGLHISLEGIYRWIVFLPSKVRPQPPVLNRFYSVLEGGAVKARGIMMRRGDMPAFIRRAQRRCSKRFQGLGVQWNSKKKFPKRLRF